MKLELTFACLRLVMTAYWMELFTLTWVKPGSLRNHFSATSIRVRTSTMQFGPRNVRQGDDCRAEASSRGDSSHVFPVKWKSFETAVGDIDTWTFDKDHAHATLNGGKTAEIKLTRFWGDDR